ncbi:MAG: ribonuclease III [Alphaproteobacteria bacterium]|nr:ribonuclease III [Alphaproteobacteria bacterium]MBF0128539.1 ribonuclease III [Alphaproteobacteria bacterium]
MAAGAALFQVLPGRALTLTPTLDLRELEREIGFGFADSPILREALTHPSAIVNLGRGRATTYERLEFLGDRVLGLVVADMLLARYPTEREGALAQRHAALVRRETLARVARILGLDRHLILSRGEEDAGGRNNPAILADACEALLGALFSRGGFPQAERLIRRLWSPLMEESATPPKDAKTTLQEWAQGRGLPLPLYQAVAAGGSAHEPVFSVTVTVEGEPSATATGSSKRLAEQAAAGALLEKLT